MSQKCENCSKEAGAELGQTQVKFSQSCLYEVKVDDIVGVQ